jgi:hypothetical protein
MGFNELTSVLRQLADKLDTITLSYSNDEEERMTDDRVHTIVSNHCEECSYQSDEEVREIARDEADERLEGYVSIEKLKTLLTAFIEGLE